MHFQTIRAACKTVTDALDEICFGFVTRVMAACQHDNMIAFGNDIYASGRYYGYLKDHGVASSPQTDKIATSLWKYNHEKKQLDIA